MSINKKHKDSVFTFLFSNPDVLRELYSAIEGINIPQDVPISINTLKNFIIKGQVNDISFTIDNRLIVLIEHQSTINNNMPLRILMYAARLYEKIIERKRLFQHKLEKIPRPEFIVLYNGKEPYSDHKELRLSNAFKDIEGLKLTKNETFPLELVVQVYNINYGHNQQMLKKSETLIGYSYFLDKIREYEKKLPLEESVKAAIKYCVDNNVLRQFLKENASEVLSMSIANWTVEEAVAASYEEGMEKGIEEGIDKGIEKITRNALDKGLSLEVICEITGLDLETIESIRAGLPVTV